MELSVRPVLPGYPTGRAQAHDRMRAALPKMAPEQSRDELFIMLLRRFRPYGGLARASELLRRRPGSANVVASAPLQFEFGGQTWLPCFQFEFGPASLDLHPHVTPVVAELGHVFDGWRLTLWFGEPNAWLEGRAPMEAVWDGLDAVCAAARADRYVATG